VDALRLSTLRNRLCCRVDSGLANRSRAPHPPGVADAAQIWNCSAHAPAAPIDSPFGRHRVQRDVPGLGLNALHPLAFMRNADQARSVPVCALAQEAQGAVIEAAAHAETVAVGIESDQGHQDEVEGPGERQSSLPPGWFRYAEAIGTHRLTRSIAQEPELTVLAGPQHRQEAASTAADGCFQEGSGVQFAVRGPVGGDPAGAQECGFGPQQSGQSNGVVVLFLRRQPTPRRAQVAS